MTNIEKIQKINQHAALTKRLYEERFNEADIKANNPQAIKWFKKCKEVAFTKIWES